jgi:hypothetical protein
MRSILGLMVVAALAACSPAAGDKDGDSTLTQPAAAEQDAVAPAFTVTLAYSAAAAAKLSEAKEQVIVDAAYYGEPNPGFEPTEPGGVDLGSEQHSVTPDVAAVPFAAKVDAAKAAKEVKGEPRVLINVYSARLSSPDNLLDCGIHDGPIADAKSAEIRIACKLIEEP